MNFIDLSSDGASVSSTMTIVQAATLFTADNTLHYIFFSIIEISIAAFILYTAWQWNESR